MRVILSFDVEVWCEGWDDLDASFPACFDTCVHGLQALPPAGRSNGSTGVAGRAGGYGLQDILDLLQRHRLHGVFFVEPLFSARFGKRFLETIVSMIKAAGQEVQLHLHPEWVDEIRPAFIANCSVKRPMLASYSLADQTALIRWGSELLQEAGAPRPAVFRAGNFGANRNTLTALARNDIWLDSSFNGAYGPALERADSMDGYSGLGREMLLSPFSAGGVCSIPVSVFRDFRNRLRHAQVGACSVGELAEAMVLARQSGREEFVILAHNFEMIHRKARVPNRIVAQRFGALCSFLEASIETLPSASFRAVRATSGEQVRFPVPRVSASATLRRYWEQFRQLESRFHVSTGGNHAG
ncbi:polysaccharide deacetylase [Lacisediminimonas profundi]|uniref:polysaccharide deacetylase n=1 Tax=Lacisediminimonas profundi TaxID=2603856 RepID=UPI00124B1F19|nr:polysaccharide deacetylase [Lacisediminimonas profundi]